MAVCLFYFFCVYVPPIHITCFFVFVFAETAAGVAVTLPGKIDNSDETRKPREDEGKVRKRGESDSPRAARFARLLASYKPACLPVCQGV